MSSCKATINNEANLHLKQIEKIHTNVLQTAPNICQVYVSINVYTRSVKNTRLKTM